MQIVNITNVVEKLVKFSNFHFENYKNSKYFDKLFKLNHLLQHLHKICLLRKCFELNTPELLILPRNRMQIENLTHHRKIFKYFDMKFVENCYGFCGDAFENFTHRKIFLFTFS